MARLMFWPMVFDIFLRNLLILCGMHNILQCWSTWEDAFKDRHSAVSLEFNTGGFSFVFTTHMVSFATSKMNILLEYLLPLTSISYHYLWQYVAGVQRSVESANNWLLQFSQVAKDKRENIWYLILIYINLSQTP